ncbi:hypothetical protein AURDEDRAFT_179667 [Auricularia subglabra TFB-10046 SS5]|nr:hypothetical protein AURDEDRAFT_179667 [Auricularia subglabra TFB-10046 SS5]
MDDTALGLELQIRGLGIRSAAILLPNNNRSHVARIDADIQHVVAAFVDGAVELYKRRNKRVPACKVPPEVLEAVFRQLELLDRVSVTAVCAFWRYVAISDALMWKELSFSFKAPRRGSFGPAERVRCLEVAMAGFATLVSRTAEATIPVSVSIELTLPPPPPYDTVSPEEDTQSFWDRLFSGVAGRVKALEVKLADTSWIIGRGLPVMSKLTRLVIERSLSFSRDTLERLSSGILPTLPVIPPLEIDAARFIGWLTFPNDERNHLTLRNVILSPLEDEALEHLHTLELLDLRSFPQLAHFLTRTPKLDTLRVRLRKAGSWEWTTVQRRPLPPQTVQIDLPDGSLPTATMAEVINSLVYTQCPSFSLAFYRSQPTFELFGNLQAHGVSLTVGDDGTICAVVRDPLGFATTVSFQPTRQATQSTSLTMFWAAFPLDRVHEITIEDRFWGDSLPITNAPVLHELTLIVAEDIPRRNWSVEARLPATLRTFRLRAHDRYQGESLATGLKYFLADILANRPSELMIEGFEASRSWNELNDIAEKLVVNAK